MRVTRNEIYLDQQGNPYRRMSLEQRTELRKYYIANVPRWRRPTVGYLLTFPLVVICSLLTIYVNTAMGIVVLNGTLFMLIVLFLALFWGVGPAILMLFLSAISLEYFVINSYKHFPIDSWDALFSSWSDLIQLLPFIVSGLIISWITAQRERARLQALAVEQELQSYARNLEEINQQLEDANQMKDHFISIASHELKTPITTIRGQAQLLLRRITKRPTIDVESVAPALERINDQTGRLTTLIDDLLDVSSIRSGKMKLNQRMFDLASLCHDMVEDQKFLTGRHISLEIPSTKFEMLMDVDRLSQVLTNLISNAAKYSPERSQIDVVLSRSQDHALLQVRDYGNGIEKDQQAHIFETFYRTPDAQSSSKRGLGLGLAITKDIVEQHKGRIWVESEVGEGSTFFVELPVVVCDVSEGVMS
jgi:signal transduction histidine kinase